MSAPQGNPHATRGRLSPPHAGLPGPSSREAMPRRPWERTRRWGQGEAGVQLLRREGRGPGLEGAPQRCAYSSSQQRSAVVSSSNDQAQGPGHCYPAATPGAGAQGSRRLTAPHPPTQGQYGTRERQAVEPGEPECLWSPAPLGLARPTLETGRLSRQRAWAALGRWPSLWGPGNASLPHCTGVKGGRHLGTQALTLSPHLRGWRVPGTSLEQGGWPGLPLSNHLHAASHVDLEQLRGAWHTADTA